MSHGLQARYLILGVILLTSQSCQFLQDAARQQDVASRYAQLGLAYLEKGDRVMAKQKLVLALKKSPNSALANTSMAYLLEQMGDLHQADVLYRKALRCAPHRGMYLNNYATFLCRQGQYQQAAHYFVLAIQDEYDAHTGLAYENAGLCALKQGNQRQADVYFKKALRHDPSRQVARKLLGAQSLDSV